ncbi:MAG: class I SAM-dependent methyltransferase [Rhodocyclaceae bacterium]|nr:class I SAM-dependent methyltransferase [Rhodocyclaceae bacterium]
MGTVYPFVVRMARELARPDGRVLEIGCGAKHYRPLLPGEYAGLDLPDSPYLDEKPDIACSAERIEAPDASFDLVFGVATFLIVPDVGAAFRECRRVLRPGGALLVVDYQKEVCERLRREDPNHRHAWDFADMSRLLAASGFPPDRIEDWSRRTAAGSVKESLRMAMAPLLRPFGLAPPWLAVAARV